MSELDGVIAQLRHAYAHLAREGVTKQKMFADGLIAPAIKILERIAGGKQADAQAEKIERLRAALESLTKDPEPTLDEPDEDWEVVVKMRAIARAALET